MSQPLMLLFCASFIKIYLPKIRIRIILTLRHLENEHGSCQACFTSIKPVCERVFAGPLIISCVNCTSITAAPLHFLAHNTLLLVTGHRPSPRAPWQRDPRPPPPPALPRPTARSPDECSGAELIDKERLRYAITGEASPCAILAAPHRSSLPIQQYLHILGRR